jgi:hypothetical protein
MCSLSCAACLVQLVLSMLTQKSLMYIVQLVFCYCSLARFTRRVLTQYLKDTVRGAGPPPFPPVSANRFPQPQETSSPSLKIPSKSSQAKDPKQKLPIEISQTKRNIIDNIKRKIPSESSQTKDPKRKIPSERFKAKDPKRTLPSERSKRKFPSERTQTKVSKRKILNDISQAKDPKLQYGDPARSIDASMSNCRPIDAGRGPSPRPSYPGYFNEHDQLSRSVLTKT